MTFYFQKIKRETNLTVETRHWVAKSINVFKTIFKKKFGRQTKKITPKWHICLLVNGCIICKSLSSGMGDDVPILGALVTLLEAMGYCCFWWCFYTSVWSDHHISSLYLVWEMMSQFWGLWSRFWRQWVTVVFDDISIHQCGQIIIYHHCIWYGRWRPNFGGSGDAFKGWWVTVVGGLSPVL